MNAIRLKQPHTARRRGAATLWIILTLPIMMMLVLYAVESGRLHLARQQLVTSLESAAMAAAQQCATGNDPDTSAARACAIDFAAANFVLETASALDLNFDPAAGPAENADCSGDIVIGTLVEIGAAAEFHATQLGACAALEGPNLIATQRTSAADWQTVSLCCRDYTSMVVVGTPSYSDTDPPMVVRIRNVTSNSFEFLVQNVNNNAPQAGFDVHFLIAEEGVYRGSTDGITMEAVTYLSTVTDENNDFVGENQGYNNAYANPVVVGQVMSFNDPDWSVFYSHNGDRRFPADAGALFTGKHVAEDFDNTRADETVGYMVFEEGAGTLGNLQYFAGDTQRTVQGVGNAPPYTYGFASDAGTFAAASQSGMRGGNGSWGILFGDDPVDPGTISVSVDEDQIADAERNHITEHVHYVTVIGPCAVRVRHHRPVDWYFSSLFGCVLSQPTIQGEATAYFDCVDQRSKLICIETFVCP